MNNPCFSCFVLYCFLKVCCILQMPTGRYMSPVFCWDVHWLKSIKVVAIYHIQTEGFIYTGSKYQLWYWHLGEPLYAMKFQAYLYPDCRLKLLLENASLLIPHLQSGLSEADRELFLDSLRLYTEKLVQINISFQLKNPQNYYIDIFSSAFSWNKLLLLLIAVSTVMN